ncbi:MAG: DUF2281 domain-containing protein [Mucilaginibacter sp.]|nr:DUF2281 domain-containing protein [Mucilaginibacter sp.]
MSTDTLIDKINKLPSVVSKDLNDYLDFLNTRDTAENLAIKKLIKEEDINVYNAKIPLKPKLKREFGGLKGFVTYIADDFDAPLEDFKDYM